MSELLTIDEVARYLKLAEEHPLLLAPPWERPNAVQTRKAPPIPGDRGGGVAEVAAPAQSA